MGTYTTNKDLFMPSIGEQGWGELVNGNFETIDTFLKPIGLSGSTYTFTGNHVGNQSGGSISATSISNSGTLTQTGTSTFTGKITANGGIETTSMAASSISNSGTLTQTGTSTFTGKITANGGVNDYEERIATLESGEFESISAGTITGDISPCFGILSDTSSEFAAFSISQSQTLASLSTSYTSNTASKTISKTYRANPFCNKFTVTCIISPGNSDKGSSINVSINGNSVYQVSNSSDGKYRNETFTVTLNDGDVLSFYMYCAANTSLTASISCGFWLINGS